MTGGRTAKAVAAALLILIAGAGPAAAAVPAAPPPGLTKGTADMRVDGDLVTVSLTFTFQAGPDLTEPVDVIPFTALRVGPSPVSDVRASTVDGQELDAAITVADRVTTVNVTPRTPLAAGERLELVLDYQVAGAAQVSGDQLVCDVPVLAPDWAPADPGPDLFAATLLLSPGYEFVEGFPSTPSQVTTQDGRDQVGFDISTTPALIRVVSTSGGQPFWTYDRFAELVILLLVVGSVAASYLHIRATARGRRPVPEATS